MPGAYFYLMRSREIREQNNKRQETEHITRRDQECMKYHGVGYAQYTAMHTPYSVTRSSYMSGIPDRPIRMPNISTHIPDRPIRQQYVNISTHVSDIPTRVPDIPTRVPDISTRVSDISTRIPPSVAKKEDAFNCCAIS